MRRCARYPPRPFLSAQVIPCLLIILVSASSVLGSGTVGAGRAGQTAPASMNQDGGRLSLAIPTSIASPSARPPHTLPSPDAIDPPTRVAYTLLGANNTLAQGRDVPEPADYLDGALFDPISNQVLAGQGDGNDVFALNATTGAEIGAIPLPHAGPGSADPEGFALDPVHDVLWTANLGSGTSTINLSTDTFVNEIPAEGPRGITYDPANQYVYTIGFASGIVTVLNATTQAVITNKTVVGASSITYDPLSNSLYLTVSGGGPIVVLNATTLQVITRITPTTYEFDPWASIFDPDARTMLVAGGANVSIINATTNQLQSTNSSVFVNGFPTLESFAFDPATREIYIAAAGRIDGSGVAALNATTGAYIREIRTGGSAPVTLAYASSSNRLFAFNGAQLTLINTTDDLVMNASVPLDNHYFGEAFDPSTGVLFVANNDPDNGCVIPGTLTIVRPSTNPIIIGSLPTGNGPQQVAVDPLHHRVFVTNLCSDTVSVIDDTNDSIVNDSVGVGGGPEGIAIDPSTGTVYVSDVYDNSIYTVNETSLSAHRLLNFSNYSQPAALAFDPVDQRLFVALYGSSNVSVLNTSSNSLLSTVIPVGAYPQGLLYDASNGLVYVSCSGSSNLTVIDASTLRVVASVSTDEGPVALALDPNDGILYVDAFNAGSVDLVQTSNNTRIPDSIPVGTAPLGIAYVPGSNQIDVSDEENGTISVLANAPQVSGVQFDPGALEAGVQASLTVEVVNGTTPYVATVNSTDGTCAGRLPTFACRFANPGSARVRIRVTDSAGYAAWWNTQVNVVPRLTLLAINSSSPTLDLGQSVQYSLSWSGGVLPISMSYFGLPAGCPTPTYPTWTCTPTAAGSYVVTVLANDSDAVLASATAPLTVYAALHVAVVTTTPNSPFVGQHLEIGSTVVGGMGPYGYLYSGLPPGCVSANVSVLTCTPSAPGNFTVNVSASDALGELATGTEALVVENDPVLSTSVVSVPQDPAPGQSLSIVVSVTGGLPPFSFSFAGLPATCPGQNTTLLVCGAPAAGSYVITVSVTDSLGQGSSATARFSVTQTTSKSGTGQGLTPLEVGFVALAAGAVGAAVVLANGRCRRRGGPPGRTISETVISAGPDGLGR
jgi:YVTN family beta-propeller protein